MASTGNRTDNSLSSHGKTPTQSFSIEAIISSTTPATEHERRRKAFTSVDLRRDGPLRPRTQLWARGYPDTFACSKTFPGLPRPIHTSLPLAMGFSEVQTRHNPSQSPLRVPAASFPSMATPWSAYRTLYPASKAEAFTNWIMSRPDVCLAPMVPGKYFFFNFLELSVIGKRFIKKEEFLLKCKRL